MLLCYTHVPTHTNSIPKLLIVVALHKITSHSRRMAALLEEKLKKIKTNWETVEYSMGSKFPLTFEIIQNQVQR